VAKRLFAYLAWPFALLTAAVATAHHSSARFESEATLQLEGIVTRFEWANPHVYIYLDVWSDSGQAEWEIEGYSPSTMSSVGWSDRTLDVGERIEITARPARGTDAPMALLWSVKRSDEVLFDLVSAFSAASQLQSSGKTDALDGTWVTVFDSAVFGSFAAPEAGMALTGKGLQAVESFQEETMLPGKDCIAITAPSFMLVPDTKQIEVGDRRIIIRSQYEGVERIVHMDIDSHDRVPFTPQGHSIGRWDGPDLIVDTARFSDHRIGNAFGLPSGSEKRLQERFSLNADGRSLTYGFELSDPEYLDEPQAGELQWGYRPDLNFDAEECQLANARRFLER
jgi:hypothetical protein